VGGGRLKGVEGIWEYENQWLECDVCWTHMWINSLFYFGQVGRTSMSCRHLLILHVQLPIGKRVDKNRCQVNEQYWIEVQHREILANTWTGQADGQKSSLVTWLGKFVEEAENDAQNFDQDASADNVILVRWFSVKLIQIA